MRKIKADRGARGLNKWLMDLEKQVDPENGCGVKQALYPPKEKKGSKKDETSDLASLGYRMKAVSDDANSNVLTDAQRDKAMKVYKGIDADHSGQITKEELVAVCSSAEEADHMIENLDVNKDGVATLNAWLSYLRGIKGDAGSDKLDEYFEGMVENVKKAKEQRKKALAEQKKTQDEEAAAYDQVPASPHAGCLPQYPQYPPGIATCWVPATAPYAPWVPTGHNTPCPGAAV